ncbi:hypothetical protein TSUD_140670 [Trifolium subterraneum]|uniref:Mediator of RNA polymerase II transcription subunit 25 n=1 Tax=Trifolium subterraneum TaxID=3900 RepID=A0A2Z6NCW2_TRISU|nr:hypothetical protein TSUD_140670 [Trifolium subterraneum]
MAEGLAEALVMYPKPCDTMTEREYYNAERHCILVAPGDPVPKRMSVCVPMIQRAQLIGQRLQACNADFLEVAQKFVPVLYSNDMYLLLRCSSCRAVRSNYKIEQYPFIVRFNGSAVVAPMQLLEKIHTQVFGYGTSLAAASCVGCCIVVALAVSLSVITPNPVPIFGAIFNMGNNVLTLSNAPISSHSTGQFTVLLSKNFKEAHNALNGKTMVESPSTTPVESINAGGANTTLFNVLNLQEQQVSSMASEAMIGEQIHEVNNVVMPDTVSTAQPRDSSALIFSTDPDNVASPNSEIRINLFDDFMTDLNSDRDIFLPNKRSKQFVTETELLNLLELDENPFGSINDSLRQDQGVSTENQMSAEEALKGYENELGEALNVPPTNASNDQTFNVELTEQVQVQVPPEQVQVQVPAPEQVQIPSPEQVQVPASNNGEGSSTGLFHGNMLESWYNPQAMMSTSTLGFQNFPTGVSNGNFTYTSGVTGNSQMQLLQNSSVGNSPMQFQENSSLGNSPMQFQQNSSLGNSPMQFQQNSSLENLQTQLQQNSSLGNSQMQFQQNSSLGNLTMQQLQQNSSLGSLQMQQLQQSSPQTQFSMFPDYSRGLMGNFAGDPIGQHLESYNQYLRNNNIAGYNPLAFGENGWLRAIPSFSLPYLSPNLYVPSISDLPNYIHTWEGNVAGKINSSRFTVMKAKAYRKTTSQITLTFRWGNRLEISHFMPQKAVNHTKRFSQPIDYVFFHVMKYNSVDLYKHLKNKYLGARIDLQYQTIILTPAEREHYYVGTVFPGDTLFIEPSA